MSACFIGMTPNPCVERIVKRRRFACHLPAAHATRWASWIVDMQPIEEAVTRGRCRLL